jgi:hypothetical protein
MLGSGRPRLVAARAIPIRRKSVLVAIVVDEIIEASPIGTLEAFN